MSVNRSYLPYKSAREYQDRKMAKWMGFFLSEHTTALSEPSQLIDFRNNLPLAEKILLLNQAYLNKLIININFLEKNKMQIVTGQITSVSKEQIGVQAREAHYLFKIDEILMISLAEGEEEDE